MTSGKYAKQILGVLADAFDVDIQLYMGKVLAKLRQTSWGATFVEWANAHHLLFEMLIRMISVAVQRVPNPDRNIVMSAATDALENLPIELRRAVLGDAPVISSSSSKALPEGDSFFDRYEQALESLSDEELLQVAGLGSTRLKEWVNSPKKIRPALLKKWAEGKTTKPEDSFSNNAKQGIDSMNVSIEKWLDEIKKGRNEK